ncbi:polycomb protein Pcl [Chironomus tepperi]|uniref:polycomb protein Pcl n=1 Tax=Chironomus tepperi TaxID=113505 RepID=UPI00391F7E8B
MSKTQNITISNQSSKIFIYNATSPEPIKDNEKKNKMNETSSLITIQFSTPEYHIRINNNFKEKHSDEKDMKSSDVEEHLDQSNDSIKSGNFEVDEDVLMEGTDGKFYLGTIINSKLEEYLIRFDDNTEKWSNSCKLKKLTASPTKNGEDSSLCVICKISKEFDVVEICSQCSRGYHRNCFKEQSIHPSRWNCSKCSVDVISISDSEELESEFAAELTTEEFNQKPTLKLPYDLSSLKWDSAHRLNKENIYCYCGLIGSWKDKMLQCCRCRQWFHNNCIKSWDGYLLHGDTFFIFCCSVCNDGNEFIRRLQITWRDIIHLIFYELTIVRSQKYHSISKDIVPFILQNSDNFYLPPEVSKFLTKESLEKKILQTVRKIDIFKCINANKKKACLFGLRKKMPPLHNHLQKVIIPPSEPFSDDLIKKLKIKYVESIQIKGKSKEELDMKHPNILTSTTTTTSTTVIDAEMCDSSDETSSKSTLDLIIPPPINFKGFNNPFHINYKSDMKMKVNDKLNGLKRNQVLNKFSEVRIVRTIKRRLSAKDLLVGPNQEVKRRKITKRRKSSDVEVISEIIQPITYPLPPHFSYRPDNNTNFIRSSNNVVPLTKNESQKKPQVANNKKDDNIKNISSVSSPSVNINLNDTVLNSPVKNNSINLYFGAMHRIENGEKFTIVAKRVTFDGNEQYLLEWDGKNESVV